MILWPIIKLRKRPEPAPPPATMAVLGDVLLERKRQDQKFGEQGHRADGTSQIYINGANNARFECDFAEKRGGASWRHIMTEEVCEAFAETDAKALRAELVQVAAVACAWIEAIDTRSKKP